jgi:energy-coupling factor transporter ATP-binding protein EcfA2
MNEPRLCFDRVEIRRMPGFESGGLTVRDLSPGVNVIYGPNASGKTSLSRAMQCLLDAGNRADDRVSLVGWLRQDGGMLAVDCDSGRRRCQRDGRDVDCPLLVPAELGDRYVLALPELLGSATGADLATEIVRQSAGGFDIAAARDTLGYRQAITTKGTNVYQNWKRADDACRAARRGQEELVRKQRQLDELKRERGQASDARVRLERLSAAAQLLTARQRRAAAQEIVDTFPPAVAKTTGDELTRLESWRKSIEAKREDQRKDREQAERARANIEQCRFPESGLPHEMVASLRAKCAGLSDSAARCRESSSDVTRLERKLEEAAASLGSDCTATDVPKLDAAAVQELLALADRRQRIGAKIDAAGSLRRWLAPLDSPGGAEGRAPDAQRLYEGAQLLSRWLAADAGTAVNRPSERVVLVGFAAMLAILSLVMGIAVHGSWLLLLLVSLAPIVWAFWPKRDVRGASSQDDIRGQFEGLGFEAPRQWAKADIAALARDLASRHAAASLSQEKAARWGDLNPELEQLARQRKELDGELSRFRDLHGLSPRFDESDAGVLAAAVRRIQEATEELVAGRAALSHARNERDGALASLCESLSRYGYEAASDAETASAQVEDLARRLGQYHTAVTDAKNADASARRLDEDIAALGESRRELFAQLGLGDGDEGTLRDWIGQRADFLAATEKLREADYAVRQAQIALTEDADLTSWDAEAIADEQQKLRAAAERWEPLNTQIIEIETEINLAKQACDLERALSELEQARDALRRHRDKDCAANVGFVLAEFLARRERDTEMPAVFRRARELFIRATHGRYRLEIDDHCDPPEFLAFDTSQEKGKRLGELSSGTRVQLLLSVRVAFVERQEHGYKLPIIFDEALGNSDERRAEQIIAAAIEFARDGRQVFYFTAQHDEVSKWRRQLKASGVEHREIDLAEVRQFSESERVPPIEYEAPPLPDVPSPEGCDWRQYGRRLRPPPLDPRGSAGDVHLWYLIDDVDELCRLLQQGVNKWGQLRALADVHAVDGLSDGAPLMSQAAAAASVVEQTYRQWRVGRGRPVDRTALVESQAVSDRYLDEVARLANELGGDAKALLAALADGKVKGFRANKHEELRRYLLDHGYLDENEALSSEQIRQLVHQAAFADIQNQSITHERVVQLVELVCRCAGEVDAAP